MKEIPLNSRKYPGLSVSVDDGDYALVIQHRWRVRKRGRNGPYAQATVTREDGRKTTISMHCLIMGRTGVDHRNGNGLDNTRKNLRLATPLQNAANRRPNKNGSSRFRGVCWFKRTEKWMAYIGIDGKNRHLGYFDVEEEAARAFDAAAKAAWGSYAYQNFPSYNTPEDRRKQ